MKYYFNLNYEDGVHREDYDPAGDPAEKSSALGVALNYHDILDTPHEVKPDAKGDPIVYAQCDLLDAAQGAPTVRMMAPFMKLVHRSAGQFTYRPLQPRRNYGQLDDAKNSWVLAVDAAVAEYEKQGGLVVKYMPAAANGDMVTAPVAQCLPPDFDMAVFPDPVADRPQPDLNSLSTGERRKQVVRLIRGLMQRFDADMLSVDNHTMSLFTNMIDRDPFGDVQDELREYEGFCCIGSWSKKCDEDGTGSWNNSIVHQDLLGQDGAIRNVHAREEMLRNLGILDEDDAFRLEIDGKEEVFPPRADSAGDFGQFCRKLIDFYTLREWPDKEVMNQAGKHRTYIVMDQDTYGCIGKTISFRDDDDWAGLVAALRRYGLTAQCKDEYYTIVKRVEQFGFCEQEFPNSRHHHAITLNMEQLEADGFVHNGSFSYVTNSGRVCFLH